MNRENRQFVPNELVEFEIQPVKVQDCKKITNHSKKNLKNHTPNFTNETGGCQHVTG